MALPSAGRRERTQARRRPSDKTLEFILLRRLSVPGLMLRLPGFCCLYPAISSGFSDGFLGVLFSHSTDKPCTPCRVFRM